MWDCWHYLNTPKKFAIWLIATTNFVIGVSYVASNTHEYVIFTPFLIEMDKYLLLKRVVEILHNLEVQSKDIEGKNGLQF